MFSFNFSLNQSTCPTSLISTINSTFHRFGVYNLLCSFASRSMLLIVQCILKSKYHPSSSELPCPRHRISAGCLACPLLGAYAGLTNPRTLHSTNFHDRDPNFLGRLFLPVVEISQVHIRSCSSFPTNHPHIRIGLKLPTSGSFSGADVFCSCGSGVVTTRGTIGAL